MPLYSGSPLSSAGWAPGMIPNVASHPLGWQAPGPPPPPVTVTVARPPAIRIAAAAPPPPQWQEQQRQFPQQPQQHTQQQQVFQPGFMPVPAPHQPGLPLAAPAGGGPLLHPSVAALRGSGGGSAAAGSPRAASPSAQGAAQEPHHPNVIKVSPSPCYQLQQSAVPSSTCRQELQPWHCLTLWPCCLQSPCVQLPAGSRLVIGDTVIEALDSPRTSGSPYGSPRVQPDFNFQHQVQQQQLPPQPPWPAAGCGMPTVGPATGEYGAPAAQLPYLQQQHATAAAAAAALQGPPAGLLPIPQNDAALGPAGWPQPARPCQSALSSSSSSLPPPGATGGQPMPVSHDHYHLRRRWQTQQRAASVSDRLPAMPNTGPEPVLAPATLAAAAMAEGGKHEDGGSFRQQPQEDDPLQDVPPFA